jgi:hypothetical protein
MRLRHGRVTTLITHHSFANDTMPTEGTGWTERRDDDNLELAPRSLELDGVLLSACSRACSRFDGAAGT